MTKLLAVALVVLVVSVAALGASVVSLRARVIELESRASPPSSPSAPGPARNLAQPHVDTGDLEARIAALEMRAAQRELMRVSAPAASTAPDTDALASAAAAGAVAEPPTIVRQAVRAELDRVEEERGNQREERARSRMRERVDALAKEAKLSADEQARIETLLDAELVEMRQLFRDMREGNGDFTSMRDQLRAVRAKTDENVKALLDDDDKLDAYEEMREDERQRAWGFGRGGGGGGERDSR